MDGRDLAIIEAIAKRLREVVTGQTLHVLNADRRRPWDALPEKLKDYFRAEARAAYEVVQEMSVL